MVCEWDVDKVTSATRIAVKNFSIFPCLRTANTYDHLTTISKSRFLGSRLRNAGLPNRPSDQSLLLLSSSSSDESAVEMTWNEKSTSPTNAFTFLPPKISSLYIHSQHDREKKKQTHSINFPKSSQSILLAICITANAAYPGSAKWLLLKISGSSASNFALNL